MLAPLPGYVLRTVGSTLCDIAFFTSRGCYPGARSYIVTFALDERSYTSENLYDKEAMELHYDPYVKGSNDYWELLFSQFVVRNYGRKDFEDQGHQEQLNIANFFYAIMSIGELKVLFQGCYTRRTALYKPKHYFDSPAKAVRCFSYLRIGHNGKYDNYYLVCLPLSKYEQKQTCAFSSHNVEKWVSYHSNELTPVMAEGYAGIHIYKVGEHTKLLGYYRDMKDKDMPTHGCFSGASGCVDGLLRIMHRVGQDGG